MGSGEWYKISNEDSLITNLKINKISILQNKIYLIGNAFEEATQVGYSYTGNVQVNASKIETINWQLLCHSVPSQNSFFSSILPFPDPVNNSQISFYISGLFGGLVVDESYLSAANLVFFNSTDFVPVLNGTDGIIYAITLNYSTPSSFPSLYLAGDFSQVFIFFDFFSLFFSFSIFFFQFRDIG